MKKLLIPAFMGLVMMTTANANAHNHYNYHNIDLAHEAVELQDTIGKLLNDGKSITAVDKGVLKTQDRLLDMYTNSYVNGGTSESTLMDLMQRIRQSIGEMTNTQPNTCQNKQPYECGSIH